MLALRTSQINDFAISIGLISVIAFMGFMTWAFVHRPDGPKTVPAIGDLTSTYVLAALNTFTIHEFLMQYIVYHENRKNYTKIIIITFAIGAFITLYISLGSMGKNT